MYCTNENSTEFKTTIEVPRIQPVFKHLTFLNIIDGGLILVGGITVELQKLHTIIFS